MGRTRRAGKAIAQRIVFAFERFGEHELANHAAAGAYAFLLSAMPAILLGLGLASALLSAKPGAILRATRAIAPFVGSMAASDAVKDFFERPLGGLAAAIGALSLLYSARLLVVTIQRGVRVVWTGAGKSGIVRANLLGFLFELVVLLAILAIFAAAEAARFATETLGSEVLVGILRTILRAAPPVILLAFVYLNYRLGPPHKPARRTALAAAILCVLTTLAFSSLFRLVMSGARYNLLYGIFGNLIVLLANVYFFFCLFFFFAELVYVEERLDALIFARYQRFLGAAASKPERMLFGNPERLIRRYGRELAAGEKVFSVGEGSKEAYFVQRGSVGIYRPQANGELRLAVIEAGEIFGEMALVQGEVRSATARADSDTLVLAIPQSVFEHYLASDEGAVRRLAELLSERLRQANERNGSSP